MSEKEEICAFCKCHAKQKCSACEIVYYCTREHQKADWKRHSEDCRMFKLIDDPKIGRHYIATRNIKSGEMVLQEKKPLLVAPNPGTEPVCLNCYVSLTQKTAKPCKNCGWPLCRDCKKHGPECQLTMKYRRSKVEIKGYSVPNDLYYSLSVMRAIALREKSPKDFVKLLNLEDHYAHLVNRRSVGVLPMGINYYVRILKDFMKFDDLNEAEIAKILGIVVINGFMTSALKENKCTAVFDRASYYMHDCHPNCMKNSQYDASTDAKMFIQTLRMIPKGQPITITYTNLLDGTEKRRTILGESKFFECMCERCKDPTEFGTMFSAVKCLRDDCTGYMLPPTFLVSPHERIPDWVCKKCNLTKPSTAIDAIVNDASIEFFVLDSTNSNELKKFVVEKSKILHDNHFLIVNAQIEIEYNDNHEHVDSMSNKLLREHITLLKKLDDLLGVIAPTADGIMETIQESELVYMTELMSRQSLRNLPKNSSEYKNFKETLANAVLLKFQQMVEDTPDKAELIRLQLKKMNRWWEVLKTAE